MSKSQEDVDRLWALKTEMVKLHNAYKNDEDYKKLLEHINTHLDPDDQQYIDMALECMFLSKEEFEKNKDLYTSIYKKIEHKKFTQFRLAARVSLLSVIVEENVKFNPNNHEQSK